MSVDVLNANTINANSEAFGFYIVLKVLEIVNLNYSLQKLDCNNKN